MSTTKEHVLVLLWGEESSFPGMKTFRETAPKNWTIDFHQVPFGLKAGEAVPIEKWSEVTILVSHTALPAKREYAPKIKWIQLFAAGVNHVINHPIIKDTDIKVTTVSGIHGPPIAEWVTMATLAISKMYNMHYENQKEHKWVMPLQFINKGYDWVGKKVGIAGYGSIGRQIAKIFNAMGSEIHAYTASPRTTPESRVDPGYIVAGTGDPDGTLPTAWYSGTSKEDMHAFLGAGLDMVVICLPLTDKTRHLFGAEEFALLGPKAIVVNIARGEIINQEALVKALNEEVIRGAALDVTFPEPLPEDDPLWDAKNVVISPHASPVGVEYIPRSFDLLSKNLERWQGGEDLINLVSREKGY